MNDIAERYKVHLLLERGMSPHSVDAYLTDLAKLMQYAEVENVPVKTMELSHLQDFVATLYDMGISVRSIARIIAGVRSFFGFMVLEGEIGSDPSELLRTPRIGLKLPTVLTIDEINRIEAAIDVSYPDGVRNRAIIELLYSCGLRISELTGLKLSDLFFDDGFIRVEGKGSKQRLVPISQKAKTDVTNYLAIRLQMAPSKGHEAFVFLSNRGKAISRITVFHFVKQYAQLADVPKNISPHTFRHSFATHLLEGGAHIRAIQQMLGHEKITTTEIYTHVDKEFLRKEILEHHPRNADKRRR